MNALSTHLDDLLAVLRVSSRLRPTAGTPFDLRDQLAHELAQTDAALAARIRGLDDWHAETLADFVTEAHQLSRALDRPFDGRSAADDTRVG